MVQGWGCGWLIRIRVCAGPAFLESGLRWSPDEFLWFSRLTSCDLLSGMKTASSSIIVNIFHLLGVLVLQKSSKILLHVSLEAEPGSCPKAALLFLDCSSLFSVSPPFPDQQLFESALWKSGKVMEAETYSLQTRNGNTERLPDPGAPQGLARFHFSSSLAWLCLLA